MGHRWRLDPLQHTRSAAATTTGYGHSRDDAPAMSSVARGGRCNETQEEEPNKIARRNKIPENWLLLEARLVHGTITHTL